MAQFLTNERYGSGSDGYYAPSTGTDAPIDSACTGTISTTSLSATNASFATGQVILIHQTQGTGAGQWELNVVSSYATGTITTKYALTYGYVTGAQVLVLKQYSNALIDTGVTLTAKAWNGTVGGIVGWLCNGLTTITGTIGASGIAASGGTGGSGIGFRGADSAGAPPGRQGESSTGTGGLSSSANGMGGGGDGDDSAGAGGGGHATSGGTGVSSGGGAGGGTGGNAGLTTMLFGGAGGAASQASNGAGGGSGGIVLIISKTITITGNIYSNGGAGGNAANDGGGGGAGGSVLLKGQALTLGTTKITATGGAAGDGVQFDGGAGGDGRIHADYFSSISGTTSPTLDSSQDNTLGDSFYGAMI